jgi:hypothetical protein
VLTDLGFGEDEIEKMIEAGVLVQGSGKADAAD